MPRKKTLNEILELFENRHGKRYDYSKVKYLNSNSKVTIICSIHGEFEITPHHHKNGVGCRNCYFEIQKTSKEEFLERSQKIWGDLYDYSLFSNLPETGGKVSITCKIHGLTFLQEPRNHLKGHSGCIECKSIRLTGSSKLKGQKKSKEIIIEEFIKNAVQIHGKKYCYAKFIYKNSETKGIIQCEIHGFFSQSPSNHLRGSGCPKCALKNKSIGSFKEKCLSEGVNYHRALKRRQAGLSDVKIFSSEYVRSNREINEIVVYGEKFPNLEEACRILKPPASTQTLSRWIKNGMTAEEAFDRIPNPGYAEGIIYLITNTVNNKNYVGLTVQTLERRWKYHLEQAKANYIKNTESLHSAIRTFGRESFKIEQIDSGTTKRDLEKKEITWIKKMNSIVPNGYNISTGGVSGGSNTRAISVNDKKFKSVKDASKYISETKGISISAATKRISVGRVNVKTPSKAGESYVKSKLYKTWSSIIHTYSNPKSKGYIPNLEFKIEWKDFEVFRNEVGEPEKKDLVFKRLDQEKGFFPDNCKWMTKSDASKINASHMKKSGLLVGRRSKSQ